MPESKSPSFLQVGRTDGIGYHQDAAYIPTSMVGTLLIQLQKNRLRQRRRISGLKHYYPPVELADAKFSEWLSKNQHRINGRPTIEVAQEMVQVIKDILREIRTEQPDDPQLPEFRTPTLEEYARRSQASTLLQRLLEFYQHTQFQEKASMSRRLNKTTTGGVPTRGPNDTIVTDVSGNPISGKGSPPIVGPTAGRIQRAEMDSYRKNGLISPPSPPRNNAPMTAQAPIFATYEVDGKDVGIDVSSTGALGRILLHSIAAKARGVDQIEFLNEVGEQLNGLGVTNDLDPTGASFVHVFEKKTPPAPARTEGIGIGARDSREEEGAE